MKKLGLGLGAFAAGAAAWTWGAGRFGDRLAPGAAPRADNDVADAAAADLPGTIAPGDATTTPAAPRPATLAAAPSGMAEAEKGRAGRADPADGHVPTDLLSDAPVTAATRAPDAFRPDPTAVPDAAEREALRPATGPAPTLVADRGSGFAEAAGAA